MSNCSFVSVVQTYQSGIDNAVLRNTPAGYSRNNGIPNISSSQPIEQASPNDRAVGYWPVYLDTLAVSEGSSCKDQLLVHGNTVY